MRLTILSMITTRSIARDLLLGLIPAIVIVFFSLGLTNYLWTSSRDARALKNEGDDIAEKAANIMAFSLYQSNFTEIGRISNIILQRDNTVALHVIDKIHKIVYNGGYRTGDDLISIKKPITYLGKDLGTVQVFLKKDKISQRQKETIYYTLLSIFSTLFVIIIATLILLEIYLGKPLSSLVDGIRAIARGSYDHILVPVKQRYINLIIKHVNTMSTKIAQRDKQLREMIDLLEQRVNQQKQAEKELFVYQDKLRLLSKELLLTGERERRGIASELHDRIGHTLTNVLIKLGALEEASSSIEFRKSLNEVRSLIEQSMQDTQSLVFEISPPVLYDLGIEAAIDWLIEQTEKQHKIPIEFNHEITYKLMDDSYNVLIFGAVRELIFNVVKHAKANSVKISIKGKKDYLRIVVEDDGVGFSTSDTGPDTYQYSGFGLFSIRERLGYINGNLKIASELGAGTRVTMTIPIELKRNEVSKETR